MSHSYSLIDFINERHSSIFKRLRAITEALKEQIRADKSIDSIDIRLCVNYIGDGQGGNWIIYTGDASDYTAHWPLCGASIVTLDTDVNELMEDLIHQILEQEGNV